MAPFGARCLTGVLAPHRNCESTMSNLAFGTVFYMITNLHRALLGPASHLLPRRRNVLATGNELLASVLLY
jgi:hypothetical protein